MRLCQAACLLSAAALLLAPASYADDADPSPIYKDASRCVDERVADLLGRMTLVEKAAQLVCLWEDKNEFLDDDHGFDPIKAKKTMPHGIGQIARPSDMWGRGEPGVTPGRTAVDTAELVNAIQRFVRDETRLGIPVLFHEEGLHGYQARDATVFPQAIALASTWDPALVEEVYATVASEMRARGAFQALAPVVDVARDPRWGRIEETYGEDPHLVAEMGVASVRGFQGPSLPLAEGKVLATLKHMTGHGQPESGTNIGPANISERVLREMFFPPFERAIREAGAASVMASYNEIDGMPSHASRWLMTEVLRGEWGFEGFVVADYYAIRELFDRHAVSADLADAARRAMNAGVDVELPNPKAYRTVVDQVRAGSLDAAQVDRAVARHLRAKFLAGLFENPFVDAAAADALTGGDDARALALRTAEKAITLLANDAKILPLDAAKKQRVAVIGPNASETLLGGYTDVPRQTVSLLQGLEAYTQEATSPIEIRFAQGVHITEERNWFADQVTLADPTQNRLLIEAAVEVATQSDVIILAIGDNEQTSREAWAEAHLGDRTSLRLVGQQEDLARAVLDTGVPTVVVLIHGQPLAIGDIAERAAAVVDAWYLGQETGTALARALFGEVNPGGKLPVTIPRSVGQLPMFYNHKPTARRGYLFDTTEPLWPFGHGLSYTDLEISEPTLSAAEISPDGSTTVSVRVRNVGQRAGDEVVQLYIRDLVSSVTRPVRELKAFERVSLDAGTSTIVSFEVGPEQLRFYDATMQRVVEPGDFELHVGSSSVDVKTVTLTVR